ncbi:hypothetical protein [Fodinibius sp. Rm-B-1B1-1]|uniref:hypothetical protein n=1 Tax=Fodinibius alkaliphilus TaxID=3140241 RepID=UPI00315A4C1B
MQFALDKNGNKISPKHSGQKARCPVCQSIVIGHYGEFRRHWQHESKRDCDEWSGEETQWHVEWKSRFPDEWQEVVISKADEIHRADIQTPSGKVLEFQNSPISSSEIRRRENFYGDMIWIINAEEFKSRLQLKSVVNKNLQRIKRNAQRDLSILKQGVSKRIDRLKNEISSVESSIDYEVSKIEENDDLISKCKGKLNNITSLADKILNHWYSNDLIWNNLISRIKWEVADVYKEDYLNKKEKIEQVKNKINSIKEQLSYINNKEELEIREQSFKIVSYNEISPQNYTNTQVIKKEDKNTLFPELMSISSDKEFERYSYRRRDYLFLLDLTEIVNSLRRNLENLEKQLINQKEQIILQKQELIKDLHELVESKIDKLNKENNNLWAKVEELKESKKELIQKKSKIVNSKESFLKKEREKIVSDTKSKGFEIMRTQKGHYEFDWKQKRKSWNMASCPLYLDFGEGYLFKKSQNELKRISIDDFVRKFKQ